MTKLIIFDLDGTLAESKQPVTVEMAALLARLLAQTRVAVISGGAFVQFLTQVVDHLPKFSYLKNLYLLPTSGAALYEFRDETWKKVYEERLSEREANTIIAALRAALEETGVVSGTEETWGERIEYRGGQVTLSALGQKAPIETKKSWDPSHEKRHKLRSAIAERLPDYSVGIGGATSIDVTKHGIDKAYGVRKLCERLGLLETDAIYVGDELESGGNDEAVYKTNVSTKSVKDPAETEQFIKSTLAA